MTMSAPTLEKILQAVNEKYGTSFEGWSQLPTSYEVGDTVPNWNAYEKIEGGGDDPQQTLIRVSGGTGTWAWGYADNEKVYLYASESPNVWMANGDGQIVGSANPPDSIFLPKINSVLGTSFENINRIDAQYTLGDYVPNWDGMIICE